MQVRQLGDAVDQFGDFLAKELGHFAIGGAGVFDGVMQQGGDDGGVIQPLFRQDGGDRDGVGEIGFTRFAQLAVMHLEAVSIGPADQIGIGARIVVANKGDEVFDVDHHRPILLGPDVAGPLGRA